MKKAYWIELAGEWVPEYIYMRICDIKGVVGVTPAETLDRDKVREILQEGHYSMTAKDVIDISHKICKLVVDRDAIKTYQACCDLIDNPPKIEKLYKFREIDMSEIKMLSSETGSILMNKINEIIDRINK